MNNKVLAYELDVSTKEDEICSSAYMSQRVTSIGEKYLTSRSDYTPLKCKSYRSRRFIDKVWGIPYGFSELYIQNADRVTNLDKILDSNTKKCLKLKTIKTLCIDNDRVIVMKTKMCNSIWKLVSKEVTFIRISNFKITMKQFSKLLAAFHHWNMVVFSGIQITDPDSALRVQIKLNYAVRRLYFLSEWDAKLYQKVLKGVSLNHSLKTNSWIDIEMSDPDELRKVTDEAQKYGITFL